MTLADGISTRLSRSVYLDALRAVALVRVVIYHAVGSWMITAFTAMPLMFFIAGTLYAASLDRRPARLVVKDRYRRIMLPYWLYLAAMIVLWGALGVLGEITPINWVGFLFPVLSLGGPVGPDSSVGLHLTWFALWYIQMHLVLSLIGGPLRRWQLERPRRLWGVLAGLFLVGALGAPALSIAVFYAACWVVGYAHHDGKVERWIRPRWGRLCLVLGPVGALMFFGFHTRAVVVAAFGVAFLGVFWLALALGLQPRIEPWLEGRGPRAVTNWFSQRSLTIYLWHGVALWLLVDLDPPGGLATRLAGCAVLIVVAVVAFGWIEDVSAKRPMQLWPRLPSARRPGFRVVDDSGEASVIDLRDPTAAHERPGPVGLPTDPR
jgi:peptidoglycan/LPS O-acetylase OafA/YrhL